MFITIQNGQLAKKRYVLQTKKKNCELILNFLWEKGFILGYKNLHSNQIKIFLKYYKGNPVVNKFKLVSKPSRRVYYSLNQLWKINSGKYFLIISTNLGLKSLKDCKKCKIGGEPFVLIK